MIIVRGFPTSQGTFGIWYDYCGCVLCFTAELPWLGNHPDTSCIPPGTFECSPHNSPDHPHTWELGNVPGRSDILLHNGNVPLKDSRGCILVGDSIGIVGGRLGVLNSVRTLDMLRARLAERFTLEISAPAAGVDAAVSG